MAKTSAGMLMYNFNENVLNFFLVHPGGPFFKNKDQGYWTIPKGEVGENENLQDTAQREFKEETGISPKKPFIPLGDVQQKGGKTVHAWAFRGDWKKENGFQSNTFQLEWPPKAGKLQHFPEIDKAEWFEFEMAMEKINQAQQQFLLLLKKKLDLR